MQLDLDSAVIVALGANLPGRFGSPEAVIAAALGALDARGLRPTAVSSLWRSAAWPDPRQPAYVNAVALIETALDPKATLASLQAIEAEFGSRDGVPNSPRVLDLDLIAHGRFIGDTEALITPHPRAAERLFVMGPLAEIAPAWVHPRLGRTAAGLAVAASVGRDAHPIGPVCIAK